MYRYKVIYITDKEEIIGAFGYRIFDDCFQFYNVSWQREQYFLAIPLVSALSVEKLED